MQSEQRGRRRIRASWGLLALSAPAYVGIVLLRDAGYVNDWSVTTYILVLGANFLANLVSHFVFTAFPESHGAAQLRAATSALTTALVLYTAGWGSILAVGFMVGATEVQRIVPRPGIWKHNVVWMLVAVTLGELAVRFLDVPTVVPASLGHFIAIVGSICLVLAIRVLGLTSDAARASALEVQSRSEHFEALVRHATDVIGVIGADGTIESMSPAITELLGLTPEELAGRPMREIVHPDELARARALTETLPDRPDHSFTVEVRMLHADGSTRLTVATLTAPADWGGRLILNLHDITTQRGLEELLRHQATHDHLTGLWNRAAFHELVSTSCARAARHGSTVAVLFIDLDGFKQVNDTQGHDVGDAVLKEAAQRIQSVLRQTEYLARLGGDEFAVLAEPVEDDAQMAEIAERLLDALAEPWSGIGEASLTASVGIATHAGAGAHPEMLLRDADASMYEAKRRGGRQWHLGRPTIRAEAGGDGANEAGHGSGLPDGLEVVADAPHVTTA